MDDTVQSLAQVRIGSIVIRCYEYERMVAFWQAALRYVVEHADYVVLEDPDRNLFCVVQVAVS